MPCEVACGQRFTSVGDQGTVRLELWAESSVVIEVAYLMAWVGMERQMELVLS